MINHPERNIANVEQAKIKPESAIPPRELRINQPELVCENGRVSLLVEIINGHFGGEDINFFSQNFPEYNGEKIEWLPAHQPVRTVRSNCNTIRVYQVQGRLSLVPRDK